MAINSYATLKSAISEWLGNSGLSGDAENIVQLAEARLNRELKAVQTEATLTGTADSNEIDISSYNVIRPINLFRTTYGVEEKLFQVPYGQMAQDTNSAPPEAFQITNDRDKLEFQAPLDEAHTFRFVYDGRFALSDSVTTNQLLTDHPDVYFASCLAWGGVRHKSPEEASFYAGMAEQFISETKQYLSADNRGALRVDPALVGIGRGSYNIQADE